jgi:hypothetical protein
MAAALVVNPALGQHSPMQATQAPKPSLDGVLAYNATDSNVITGNSFWMQGAEAQIHGQIYRGWGVVADVAGMHTANIRSSGVGLDMIAATFGPRYTWSPAHGKYSLYGHALAGAAIAMHGLFPSVAGASSTGSSLAFQLGGGANVSLTPRFGLRAFEADWMRTQLPNSTNNVQNNLRIGTGFIFRFK